MPLPARALPRYAELPPPAALAPWVACLWQLRGTLPPGVTTRHRVLPDGCIDLILEPGRPSAAMLVGPMSTAIEVPLAGALDVVGLRLRPGAHVLLEALDASELVDLSVEPAAAGLAARTAPVLAAADGHAEDRPSRIWAALLPLVTRAPVRDPLLAHALACWARAPGTIRELVRDTGVSERTLERRFLRACGLRPAELRRLSRFRAALRLHGAGAPGWAAVAADAGYADQAHLSREFRRLAGVSPTAWAAEQARVGFVQDGAVATL